MIFFIQTPAIFFLFIAFYYQPEYTIYIEKKSYSDSYFDHIFWLNSHFGYFWEKSLGKYMFVIYSLGLASTIM